MNTKSSKKPILYIYVRSNGTQWTFEDAIGRVRTGFDPTKGDESSRAKAVLKRTINYVEKAVGYSLTNKLNIKFDTDFSEGSENIEHARNAYFP